MIAKSFRAFLQHVYNTSTFLNFNVFTAVFFHFTSLLTWDQSGCLWDCPPAVMAPQPPWELALAAQTMCGLFIYQPPLLLRSQLLLELQSIWFLPQSILIPERQTERRRWEIKTQNLFASLLSLGSSMS